MKWKTNFPNFGQTEIFSFFSNKDFSKINSSWLKSNQKLPQQAKPAQTGPNLGHMRARPPIGKRENSYFFVLYSKPNNNILSGSPAKVKSLTAQVLAP